MKISLSERVFPLKASRAWLLARILCKKYWRLTINMDISINPITKLTHQLIEYFAIFNKNSPPGYQRCGELIRFQTDNLVECGDLSIAACRINWQCFCQKHNMQLRTQADQVLPDDQAMQDLLETSKKWLFPLQSITKLRKERYALRFNRSSIIEYVLFTIQKQGANYGKYNKLGDDADNWPTLCLTLQDQVMEFDVGNARELHRFRARQLFLIISRILDYAKWRPVSAEQQSEDTVHVTVQCNNQARHCLTDQTPNKHVVLLCAPVLEPAKKTATTLTSDSYMSLRSNDMLLIAMHRNGVRNCKNKNMDDLMQRLGHAAVIVDLFEVRHNSSSLVVRNGLGSSKGASYILYNSARLETLLRIFDYKVASGVYDPLPPLDTIDLSLLDDEIEWQLIYGYLLTFPELMNSTLNQLQQGQCAVHLLVHFIVDFASLFSRYYRNKHILLQNRLNLMPVLYARIHLIKAVRQVLNSALAILGIQPVDYM